jgi:hypothetical protein
MPTVRVPVHWEAPGSSETDYAEFDRAEWDSWTPEQQEAAVNETAEVIFTNNCSYGYSMDSIEYVG